MNRIWFFGLMVLSIGAFDASANVVSSPSLELMGGGTSNAPLLSTPAGGAYVRVAPSLNLEYEHGSQWIFSGALGGQHKHFNRQTLQDLANETSADLFAEALFIPNDYWELGTDHSYLFVRNSFPFYSGSTVQARPQQYFQYEPRLTAGWYGDQWSWEGKLGARLRRYATTVTDAESRTFRDDFDQYRFVTNVIYDRSESWQFRFSLDWAKRDHAERMGDFSDGYPALSGTTHPLLVLYTQDYDFTVKYKGARWTSSTVVTIGNDDDQVFGALDSMRLKLAQSFEVKMPFAPLVLKPELSIERQNYSFYRSDFVSDPVSSPLRLDWVAQVRLATEYPLLKSLNVQTTYVFNRRLSNYSVTNYVEHGFEAGLVYRM